MKPPSWFAFSCLLGLGTAALAPLLWPHASQPLRTQAAKGSIDSWTRENYGRALDLVFQGGCAASTGAQWFSCVRSLPGHSDEIEYSMFVERRYDGTVFARIGRPRVQSIYCQLRQLRKRNPHGSVDELAKLIRIESQMGDQQRFRRLVELAADFEHLRISPIPPDEIIMDATQYRFRIGSSSGEMDITLRGPGSAAPHQSNALIQWAESAEQMLLSGFSLGQVQ